MREGNHCSYLTVRSATLPDRGKNIFIGGRSVDPLLRRDPNGKSRRRESVDPLFRGDPNGKSRRRE